MYKTKVKLFDEFLRLNVTFIKYFLDLQTIIARVAELVDALDSKSSDSNIVLVRPRPRVQKHLQNEGAFFVSLPTVCFL